jgi:palmitoyltransferase
MDHHCPWTGNCVSLQTFPHFMRFLTYANVSLWTLAYFLYQRAQAIWADRHLPSYLGPTLPALIQLVLVTLVCSGTMLALGIMLFTTAKAWVFNTTMIEGWQLERHEAVLGRHDRDGDEFWSGDPDKRLRLEPVEFPYEIGFFKNMAQAMGTRNVLLWFFPLAGGPVVGRDGGGVGWEWEENGFNRRTGMWPPLDPEKLQRAKAGWPGAASRMGYQSQPFGYGEYGSPAEAKAAFRRRQEEDGRRRQVQGSQIMAELEEVDNLYDVELEGHEHDPYEEGIDGEPGWTNSDGDRLRDYGVDEEVEAEDLMPIGEDEDEDLPLGELKRRRKTLNKDKDDDGDGW